MSRDGNEHGSLGRTEFVQVSNTFTRNRRRKSCVDYFLDAHIYDNIDILARIVKGEVTDAVVRKRFLAQIYRIEEYLKYYCAAHIGWDTYIFHCTTA